MVLSSVLNNKYFDEHKHVSFFFNKKSNLQGYIAVHRGRINYPSFGATRILNYKSSQDALIDALKLSKIMSYKAAISGLKCGGAKAVIMDGSKQYDRKDLLNSYAEIVNGLGGSFITGADVGMQRSDIVYLKRRSRYFVGVKVNPVRFTALGLYYSIQTCLKEQLGSESLETKSFAIQGAGKVGKELLKLIYPHTHDVYICDIDKVKVRSVLKDYPKVKVVDPKNIYDLKVDVFSPCALSGCLNKNTIRLLNCKIIVGGANNQLESDDLANIIYKKGILYAPDYLVNSGGLISVYDEYNNKNVSVNHIKQKVHKIKKVMSGVIKKSKSFNTPELFVANKIAEELISKYE